MKSDDQSSTQTDSSSSESTGKPVFTPQSSTRFSPVVLASSPGSRPEDTPIPSIEPPTPGLFELPDNTTKSLLASSNTFDNVIDTLKEVRLSTPDSASWMRQFGQDKSSSTFTFRNLHNTTPEPSSRAGQTTEPNNINGSGSGSGSGNKTLVAGLGAAQSLALQTSAKVTSLHVTKLRASSAPAQPPALNQSSKPGKYDTNDETPPDEPYFNEEFQRALQKGKFVARRIADILGTCDLAQDRDSQVFSMIHTANELRQFDAPSMCRIGIVGDSGVGKSSLINSLLDEADLAQTAGLGAACTSVVTEYRLRELGHTAKYTIEIDRMTDNEIEEQLQELLWSYRCFHLSDLDDKGMTADEQKRLEDQSKLAWDTLKAAFGSERELTEAYLQDSSAGAEERIQRQLTLWTNTLQWPGDSHESGWLGSADTVDECKRKMQQFLTGNLWPFIKVIRLFLSSQVLKSGAILADLPGFHDSNNARVKAAEQYMYGCDEIFVVADIARVGTNKNVEMILQKSLGSNLKNGRPSQGIALVCTKSEDLDVDEIRKKFFTDSKSANAARVKLLERTIEEAEADDGRAGALRQRDDAQDELDYLYMTARNDYIEKLVRSNHAKLFKSRPLSVFCISNKMYKKNRRRVKVHDLPIKGSGVPALRSHCHRIPAQAQFKIAHHFLTVSLKALVQRVQLWLAGGSQETMPNDATVQKMLETLQNDLQKTASHAISTAEEAQKGTSMDIMIQPMTVNIGNWTQDALEVSGVWGTYHHTQIAGFCRSYGSWGSAKIEFTEWNLELIESMVDKMTFWWDDHAETSATLLTELQNTILKSLDGLISQVKDFHGAPLFAEALVTKIDLIKYTFEEAEKNFTAKMDSIKRDASQNHRSAYIFEEMRPAYRDCCLDSGSGVTARRLSRLRQAIGSTRNPILFIAIRSRLRNALFELAAEITATLGHDISDILKQIGNNIEMLRGSEAKILAKNGDFLEKLDVVITAVVSEMKIIGVIAAQVKSEAEEHKSS